ncbi:MAG: hypothetical protein EXR79_15670 [Myxococcales bacterium]|nr:hypothetical protein [Myxococcales bacterium]
MPATATPPCTWCGATRCDPADAFHELLRRHGLHAGCWSDGPPGWLELIDALFSDLRTLGWRGELAQIKQKFGRLRVYADGLDAAMAARITRAEAQSLRTCDRCGQPCEVVGAPWRGIETLCRTCLREGDDWTRRAWRQTPAARMAGLDRGVYRLGPAVRSLQAWLGRDARPGPLVPVPWLFDRPPRGTCRVVLVPARWRSAVALNVLGGLIDDLKAGLVLATAVGTRADLAQQLIALHVDLPPSSIDRDGLPDAAMATVAAAARRIAHARLLVDDRFNRRPGDALAVAMGAAAAGPLAWYVLGDLDWLTHTHGHAHAPPPPDLPHAERAAWALTQLLVLAQRTGCGVVVVAGPPHTEAVHPVADVLAAEPRLREAVQVVRIESSEGPGDGDVAGTCDGRPVLLRPSGRLAWAPGSGDEEAP